MLQYDSINSMSCINEHLVASLPTHIARGSIKAYTTIKLARYEIPPVINPCIVIACPLFLFLSLFLLPSYLFFRNFSARFCPNRLKADWLTKLLFGPWYTIDARCCLTFSLDLAAPTVAVRCIFIACNLRQRAISGLNVATGDSLRFFVADT